VLNSIFEVQKRCMRAMSGEFLFAQPGLCLRHLICCLCFQFICWKVASMLGIFRCSLKGTKTFKLITQAA
jgi:hypothetical protein